MQPSAAKRRRHGGITNLGRSRKPGQLCGAWSSGRLPPQNVTGRSTGQGGSFTRRWRCSGNSESMQIALYLILRMGVRVRTLSTLTLFKGPGWDRRRRPSDDDDDNGVENQRSWLHSMALASVAARSAAPQASRPRRDAPLAAARAARPVRLRPKADLDARGGPEAQPPQPQESKSVPPQAARLRRDASIDAARAAARPVLRPRPKADYSR